MENVIFNSIKDILEKESIKLISVRLGEEDGVKTLFVTIDSENGVDTDLCVKTTKIINPIIDKLDLDLSDYILDVGSMEGDINE
jgi:ribosome maturation factor RimP